YSIRLMLEETFRGCFIVPPCSARGTCVFRVLSIVRTSGCGPYWPLHPYRRGASLASSRAFRRSSAPVCPGPASPDEAPPPLPDSRVFGRGCAALDRYWRYTDIPGCGLPWPEDS